MDRYYKTKQYVDDAVKPGVKRYGLWVIPELTTRPEIPLRDDQCTKYTVAQEDIGRMDLLAYKFYNDSTLWWIIALHSGIKNPLSDMYVGQILTVPDKKMVDSLIATKK